MRKGLWSPDEDERLVRCITKYVNGSWSDIARKAGLDRCGKSCRRRWMNHLRPDLKRGKFSMDEINLIVQLQEALGNRWSDIASHLDGRTDNDVKNLWNTQIKKKLAQLKAQGSGSGSSLPLTFDGSNMHVVKNLTQVDNFMSNVELLESYGDEIEKNGDVFIRFNGGNAGALDCSCSASSCDGHVSEPNCNQDNNPLFWTPNNVSLQSQRSSMQAACWGNNQDHDTQSVYNSKHAVISELNRQNGAADRDDSLMLIRSCSSSSSSINNPMSLHMTAFLQQPALLPADNDDDTTPAETIHPDQKPMMPLSYGSNHFSFAATGTVTPASLLESTTSSGAHLTALKRDNFDANCTGIGVVIAAVDDTEECCSLQPNPNHSKFPISNEALIIPPQNLTKNPQTCFSNDMFNLYCATGKFGCSSISKNDSHSHITTPHRLVAQEQSHSIVVDDAKENTILGGDDYMQMIKGGDHITGRLVIASRETATKDHVVASAGNTDHLPLPWDQNASIGHQQSTNCLQGWDVMGETAGNNSNMMPQFSFPDWCKHLLHGDLL